MAVVKNTGSPPSASDTWQSQPHEVQAAVETALRTGYRHIDTATDYGNEAEVGAGIQASGVPRSHIWLTTKLFVDDHKRGVAKALDDSLAKLGVDHVDLYLIHWPPSVIPGRKAIWDDWNFVDTWREMQKLVGTGKANNIGVELHPVNPSLKLVAYAASKGIHSTGYSCLASTDSPLYTNATLKTPAHAKGKTVQQVLLVWGIQKGWSVIPKSVTPARIEANFDLDGWSLTDDEMKTVDGASERFKVCGDDWLPSKVFFGDDE